MSNTLTDEPYRLFFPTGVILLLWGVLIWLPQIWSPGDYPVLAHRYLMLNGFTASFIAGFLMTAVPRFSQTDRAKAWELLSFFILTLIGLFFAYQENESFVFLISAFQPFLILLFLGRRILHRKANPPYSFIFIFIGLFLWIFSALGSFFSDPEVFKGLHYEGAVAAIILGVGSRLIPGILGHVEIVSGQRGMYERPVSLLKTVPRHFFLLIGAFVLSYAWEDRGIILRSVVVAFISFKYWRLYSFPKEKTALTWCLWISSWLILLSFVLRALWTEGGIHANHSFFINGIVLLSLLIATRVIQSHGPKDKLLENKKVLYVMTGIIVFAAATRVTAYLMPEQYLSHLGYSSLLLAGATLLWSYRYLRYVMVR